MAPGALRGRGGLRPLPVEPKGETPGPPCLVPAMAGELGEGSGAADLPMKPHLLQHHRVGHAAREADGPLPVLEGAHSTGTENLNATPTPETTWQSTPSLPGLGELNWAHTPVQTNLGKTSEH